MCMVLVAAGLGWLAGVATGERCEIGALYNPFEYWRLLSLVTQSPWAIMSPELRQSIVEAKKEIAGIAVMGVAAAGAWHVGGPVAVQGVLAYLGTSVGTRSGAHVAQAVQQIDFVDDGDGATGRPRQRRRPRKVCANAGNTADAAGSLALVPAN